MARPIAHGFRSSPTAALRRAAAPVRGVGVACCSVMRYSMLQIAALGLLPSPRLVSRRIRVLVAELPYAARAGRATSRRPRVADEPWPDGGSTAWTERASETPAGVRVKREPATPCARPCARYKDSLKYPPGAARIHGIDSGQCRPCAGPAVASHVTLRTPTRRDVGSRRRGH